VIDYCLIDLTIMRRLEMVYSLIPLRYKKYHVRLHYICSFLVLCVVGSRYQKRQEKAPRWGVDAAQLLLTLTFTDF
jgi:hypothetical protein